MTERMISFLWLGVFVLLVTASIRRRHLPVGGWLLFLPSIVILNGLSSLVQLPSTVRQLLAAHINDRHFYILYFSVNLPGLLVVMIEAPAAFELLRRKEWVWVRRLKVAAGLVFAARVLTLVVQMSDQTPRLISLPLGEVLLLAYLSRSERVRRVFQTNDWGRAAHPGTLNIAYPPPNRD
jgi:hypothetical protein